MSDKSFVDALKTIELFESDCPRCVGNFYGDDCTCGDVTALQAYHAQKVVSDEFEKENNGYEEDVEQLRAELAAARAKAVELAGAVDYGYSYLPMIADPSWKPGTREKLNENIKTAADVQKEWG